MALPTLQRKLFENDGYGPKIKDERLSTDITVKDWDASHDYPANVLAKAGGDIYRSVAASGPGTSAGAVNPTQDAGADYWEVFGKGDSVPVGTVLWLSTSTPPAGYLLCNGSAVGRATYPELFTAIGTVYGAGDGSTTFNLPNLIDKFAEGSTVAGTAKNAGLPNITGTVGSMWLVSDASQPSFTASSALTVNYGSNSYVGTNSRDGNRVSRITFNASRSNSIYGNSDTVQPSALTLLPCIKAFSSVVGNATVVAGQLVNEIQSKVALDGSNISSIGSTLSEYIAHAAMPSGSYIELSLPPNNGYVTAPADGYVCFEGSSGNSAYNFLQLYTNIGSKCAVTSLSDIALVTFLPVRKNVQVHVNYSSNVVDTRLIFVYANGAL